MSYTLHPPFAPPQPPTVDTQTRMDFTLIQMQRVAKLLLVLTLANAVLVGADLAIHIWRLL